MDAPGFEEWHHVVWICIFSFCNEAKDWSIAFGREVQLAALISIGQILVRFREDWKQSLFSALPSPVMQSTVSADLA